MPLEFAYLADRVDAIPTISKWYFDEWGHLSEGDSIERTRDQMQGYMNRDEILFTLLATDNHEIVGAAQLKYHELVETFPDKEHWLGGVYISPSHRGKGCGSQIVKIALRHGVRTLHLQTEVLDGGLYARLGWTPLALASNRGLDVRVMERHLPVLSVSDERPQWAVSGGWPAKPPRG